ncbi:glycolipid transfer protein domain-containing protein 2 isoform X1 [Tachyglossus aculeatus]|uniref:glycolipid transfer protein domain-containing protein 2 isoform X1 n=1 Tax=Tachyglossus aculeatus TaxID=9261 RepID=UPI0018F64B54|nr:glycolipid transfer protein domain-containing protein 2 isoform X1 [Tachyglossus aculeatus]
MGLELRPPQAPRAWRNSGGLCGLRLLLPLGVFAFLLYLSNKWLPVLPLSDRPRAILAPQGSPSAKIHCLDPEILLGRLVKEFTASVATPGDLKLDHYLAGWRELIRFLSPLGTVFSFVTQEATSKLSVLDAHSTGPHAAHYASLSTMASWELSRGLVDLPGGPARDPALPRSGLRTLLLLHRALHWVQLFLAKLAGPRGAGDTGVLCAEAYREALAPYHSWFIRQAAGLAFLAMPPRGRLLDLACPGGREVEAVGAFGWAAETLQRVYNVTQNEYAARGLLELP